MIYVKADVKFRKNIIYKPICKKNGQFSYKTLFFICDISLSVL